MHVVLPCVGGMKADGPDGTLLVVLSAPFIASLVSRCVRRPEEVRKCLAF